MLTPGQYGMCYRQAKPDEIQRSLGWKKEQDFRKGKNRIRRNTPAVTRVEECTRAETGVGAAMAAGSQAEKGICALLVIAATIIVKPAQTDK